MSHMDISPQTRRLSPVATRRESKGMQSSMQLLRDGGHATRDDGRVIATPEVSSSISDLTLRTLSTL